MAVVGWEGLVGGEGELLSGAAIERGVIQGVLAQAVALHPTKESMVQGADEPRRGNFVRLLL